MIRVKELVLQDFLNDILTQLRIVWSNHL